MLLLDIELNFKRKQMPVHPSFGMTINKHRKIQVLILEHAGIYLPCPFLTYGHSYETYLQECIKKSLIFPEYQITLYTMKCLRKFTNVLSVLRSMKSLVFYLKSLLNVKMIVRVKKKLFLPMNTSNKTWAGTLGNHKQTTSY